MSKDSKVFEINFDGLIGPTHNYSGLAVGNFASMSNKALVSNPLQAVLQGLEKMKKLYDLGLKQAVLPPQERPHIPTLRALGYSGSEKQILERVATESPELLSAVSSASSMWVANAATVSPSADTKDHKVHFTPANLTSKVHRTLETQTTAIVLKEIFKNPKHFTHHAPLPSTSAFGDEGAANHSRLCADYGKKGVEFFVFGRDGFKPDLVKTKRFSARQTYAASSAISRLHLLDPAATVFARQNPEAIDKGVFHNDVVNVGNKGVFFCHEQAYLNPAKVFAELKSKYHAVCGAICESICGETLTLIQVPASAVSLKDAVASYLFNSQLISLPEGGMCMVLPEECKKVRSVVRYLKELQQKHGNILREFLYFDLRQSMNNGGGPACLRLRVILTEKELKAMNQGVIFNESLYKTLVKWAHSHYRDKLRLDDLRDPKLLHESRAALDRLTSILKLGSIYSFQK